MASHFAGRDEVLIATLGTAPAVVTAALDRLLELGRRITEVVVVHTTPVGDRPAVARVGADKMAASLSTVRNALIESDHYVRRDERVLEARFVPLRADGRLIDDIHTPAEAKSVFGCLYREVQQLKQRGAIIHLCIAGGRKSMSVYGMAVAQLLFDADDRLWHLLSSRAFQESDALHPDGPDDATLVRIPALPLTLAYLSPVASLLEADDPIQAISDQENALRRERLEQCRSFLYEVLTDAERDLVLTYLRHVLVSENAPTHRDLGRELKLAERSVSDRFSEIWGKLADHFELYDQKVGAPLLVGLFAPYYEEIIG